MLALVQPTSVCVCACCWTRRLFRMGAIALILAPLLAILTFLNPLHSCNHSTMALCICYTRAIHHAVTRCCEHTLHTCICTLCLQVSPVHWCLSKYAQNTSLLTASCENGSIAQQGIHREQRCVNKQTFLYTILCR